MTLWFSEISGNGWGITSFSRPDSSSCSQQDHSSWIPSVTFLKGDWQGTIGDGFRLWNKLFPSCFQITLNFVTCIGHAAKDIPDRTDLSGFGWLDSWWIDHLILLRLHLSVDYVRVPQIWDRHLLPFFWYFCCFFPLFRYFKVNGISLSVLLILSEDKYCIIYYFNVILVLYRRNYRSN